MTAQWLALRYTGFVQTTPGQQSYIKKNTQQTILQENFDSMEYLCGREGNILGVTSRIDPLPCLLF